MAQVLVGFPGNFINISFFSFGLSLHILIICVELCFDGKVIVILITIIVELYVHKCLSVTQKFGDAVYFVIRLSIRAKLIGYFRKLSEVQETKLFV